MCGIVGVVGSGDESILQKMNRLQVHRGPDDEGTWHSRVDGVGFVGLGSRRLAILDLSAAGHMPMQSADGRFTIVYNGEIYNHLEIRAELKAAGYAFRSSSDTETVLYAFSHWGAGCVTRFNGMFAFGIWDGQKNRLFLARDHFGIKPLYYSLTKGSLSFASELKCLLLNPEVTRRIDYHALHQYMSFLWVPEPSTIFADVAKIPAAHYAFFERGALRLERYWDLRFPAEFQNFAHDERDLATELSERFRDVVRGQMLSDVPVGAFLSAGMDSSSIVACMAAASSGPVHTYTISFPTGNRSGEVPLDDARVAAQTAKHFGCVHSDIVVEPNTAELLPKLLWHMDEPTADPALITAFLINREARKSVTVLLSGIGGDELFGGYRKYQAHYYALQYQRLPRALREQVLERLGARLPSLAGTSLGGQMRFLKKMLRSASLPPQERFIMDSVYFDERQKNSLYAPELRRATVGYDPRHQHLDCFSRVVEADFLNQMLYLDSRIFMPSLNLNYNDKMSMASSAEVRVPFLDWRLAQWAAENIPPKLKIYGGETKYILRKAMGPMLPPAVLNQGKAGFGAPVGGWLRSELSGMVRELLSTESIRRRGLFDAAAVHHILKEHYSMREDRAFAIWQLLILEIWFREFVDKVDLAPT